MRNIPNEFEGKMELVRKIMDRELTPLQRDAVIKYYMQNMTLAQIAEERYVNVTTVWRTLLGAMRKIRRYLLLDEEDCEETVNSVRKNRAKACNRSGKCYNDQRKDDG